MKKIAYVIPYFGKLPKGFRFWLLGAKSNDTVDFLIFTDDRTDYDFPNNVKVTYLTFEEMKSKIQSLFDFHVFLDRPYKLCDFRPAFGDIFSKELTDYDFWGYCDLDIIFGDIRKFVSEEMLDKYDRVGCQGHSTLLRNTPFVNMLYQTVVSDYDYKTVFSSEKTYAFDELGMDAIFNSLNIEYYKKTNFVHLTKFDYNFFMALLPSELDYKNKYQVFTWKNGKLIRHLIVDDELLEEEYMYLHYWLRPTSFRIKKYDTGVQYLIYPDVTTDKYYEINKETVIKKSRQNKFVFYSKYIWQYRKKLNLRRIVSNINGVFYNKRNRKGLR